MTSAGGQLSADDWLLVGIASAMFLSLGLFGWLRPKLWLWRWADVIYYPLAALGIVLLFFTNDINRTLLRIEANQAAAEAAWRERPNPRPDVDFAPGSVGLLEARYGWFDAERRLGEVCAMSTSEGCSAHNEHAEALRATFGDFSVPKEGDAVALARAEERFCQAGFAYVERLSGDSLFALGAYDQLKTALGQLAKGKDEAQLEAWLSQQIAEEQRIFATVANEKERAIAAPYIKVEAEHSIALLGQLSWCATRDNQNSQNLKTLDAWQVEETNRAQTRARYARDLEAARENKVMTPLQQASRSLQQQWWPYFLMLALSIKFGKATAAVSDDLTSLFNRGRTGWRRIVAWLVRRRRKKADAVGPNDVAEPRPNARPDLSAENEP
jgi:hypothetical protein